MKSKSWSQVLWAPFKATPCTSPTLDEIPDLIDQMLNSDCKTSAAATKRIYELCDVGHKQNRVPMICGGKCDLLTPLAKCLTQESGDGRHLACLALNNLSVPGENKPIISASRDVIGGLCKVIAEDAQESYLCCICLMNLSFFEDNAMLQHSPYLDGKVLSPLDNPNSLLRVLERLFVNTPAVPKSELGKSETEKLLAKSPTVPEAGYGDSTSVRWACGLMKNLAKSEENAALIEKTDIPKCVVGIIRATKEPPSFWKSNSLEDYSLSVLINLSEWPVSRETLIRVGAVDVIQRIMSDGDPKGLKTTAACSLIGLE